VEKRLSNGTVFREFAKPPLFQPSAWLHGHLHRLNCSKKTRF